jgi:predicted acetyltransferase
MRKYRGRGVGAQAAASLFDQFPGRWTVRQQLTNPAATAFWRKAIRHPFQEHEQGAEKSPQPALAANRSGWKPTRRT